MTQSGLCIFSSSKDKSKLKKESDSPDNVQGWLINVHSFRKEKNVAKKVVVDSKLKNTGRPESIHSVDSVDLDDLISANYTADMDDETDLPDLAHLDIIDDSTEDFWNLNQTDETTSSFNSGFNELITKVRKKT
ncbi:hypothetical protein G6F56_012131 [Rhizopus delemar]|nr:hypothetical protein G6F56_012131 [Rhizopus delemar]